VPEDASVVVVADPNEPLPEPAVTALRKYMTNPTKKGKLIVLASTTAGPDRKVLMTGLEPLLAELNVQLGNQFIYHRPTAQLPAVDGVLGGFSEAALENPILQAIAKVATRLLFASPREVSPTSTNPAFQATDLIRTTGQTWLEAQELTDFKPILKGFDDSRANRDARGLSTVERPLAVVVSERATSPGGRGTTARAAVFGSSLFVSDAAGRQGQPPSFDMIGVAIDWLRERPSIATVGFESKKYTEYRFPHPTAVDTTRLLYLPLGLGFLTVLGLGAGVWVIRRR
jgi:hypothetical protein